MKPTNQMGQRLRDTALISNTVPQPNRNAMNAQMIGPAFTSVFAVLILQEAFTVYHLLGIVITVIGVSLLPRN